MSTDQPSSLGPDPALAAIPTGILQRSGRMHIWAFRLVLAFLDRQADAVVATAALISAYDDRDAGVREGDDDRGQRDGQGDTAGDLAAETVAGARSQAGRQAGRYAFAVGEAMELLRQGLTDLRGRAVRVSNAQAGAGVRELVDLCVPEQDRPAARAVAGRLLADQQPLTLPGISTTDAGVGELYVVTALIAWLADNPRINPSRESFRSTLLHNIAMVESDLRRVPQAERLSAVTDGQAVAFIHAVTDDMIGERLTIAAAADQRTLFEVDLVAAAKTHLLQHPDRTPDTDQQFVLQILQTVAASATALQAIPGDEMTESERQRAEKLAARRQRQARTRPRRRR